MRRIGTTMDRFDDAWEYDAEYDAELDSQFGWDCDAEGLYLSLIPDEEGRRYWSEPVWSGPVDDDLLEGSILFADRGAEAELRKEIRLSQLWAQCGSRSFTLDEFCELSMLVTEVSGIRGALCVDCDMLNRPNVSANWALATTTLCRGHLRFRLGHARIEGEGTSRAT